MTDKEATKHLRLIYYVIRCNEGRLGSRGIDKEEAFSAGLVGLAKAINDYDEVETPTAFFKFAYRHIWNSIFGNPRRHDIRIGLRKIRNAYYQKTGLQLHTSQLATLLDVEDRPKLLRDHLRETMSYKYAEVKHYGDFAAQQQIYIDEDDPLPEEAGSLETEFFNEIVMKEVNALPELPRMVIKLYHGLDGLEKCTFREIYNILPCKQREIRAAWKLGTETLSQNKRLQVLTAEI